MNIYFCYEPYENCGLYVIASSRGRAKDFYGCETDANYIDIRCTLIRKGVKESSEGCIQDGDPIMKKYNLHYYEEG